MKETKLPIKSMADWKRERRRLKAEIAEHELLMREDVAAFKESLRPLNAASSLVSKFVTSGDQQSMLNHWLKTGVTFALRNVVLAKAGWFTKLVVPLIASNYANHKIDENKANIVGTVRNWLHKVQNRRHKSQGNRYYDRSTADTNF